MENKKKLSKTKQYKLIHNEEFYKNINYNLIKNCPICGQNKELSEFNKERQNKDGFNHVCRECKNKQRKLNSDYKKNISTKKDNSGQFKTCKHCGELKELSEFNINHEYKDGHTNTCRKCKNAKDKILSQTEKRKNYLKIYHRERRLKIKQSKLKAKIKTIIYI